MRCGNEIWYEVWVYVGVGILGVDCYSIGDVRCGMM
jgi:hypothetical protein